MTSFMVRGLPSRVIINNRRDERVAEGHDRNTVQSELQSDVVHAIQATFPEVPRFERASVMLSYRSSNKRPKDGCHRTRGAVWELTGSILAAVCLGVIDAGMIPKAGIVYAGAGYEPVDGLVDEGLFVTIQGL